MRQACKEVNPTFQKSPIESQGFVQGHGAKGGTAVSWALSPVLVLLGQVSEEGA